MAELWMMYVTDVADVGHMAVLWLMYVTVVAKAGQYFY